MYGVTATHRRSRHQCHHQFPYLAVSVRRLHYIDRTGWLIWVPFIVALLILAAADPAARAGVSVTGPRLVASIPAALLLK